MLRKYLAAGLVAGMLALGAASATSLGLDDGPTFAASTVDLQECTAESVQLRPGQVTAVSDPDVGLVYVNELIITGLDCDGDFLDFRFTAENGATLGARFNIPLETPDMVIDVKAGQGLTVDAEEVYGVTLIAHDYVAP